MRFFTSLPVIAFAGVASAAIAQPPPGNGYSVPAQVSSEAPEQSTIYQTVVSTITSCGTEVVNCPARSTVVTTSLIPVVTTSSVVAEAATTTTPEAVPSTTEIPVVSTSAVAVVSSSPVAVVSTSAVAVVSTSPVAVVSTSPVAVVSTSAVAIAASTSAAPAPPPAVSVISVSTCIPTTIYSTVTVGGGSAPGPSSEAQAPPPPTSSSVVAIAGTTTPAVVVPPPSSVVAPYGTGVSTTNLAVLGTGSTGGAAPPAPTGSPIISIGGAAPTGLPMGAAALAMAAAALIV